MSEKIKVYVGKKNGRLCAVWRERGMTRRNVEIDGDQTTKTALGKAAVEADKLQKHLNERRTDPTAEHRDVPIAQHLKDYAAYQEHDIFASKEWAEACTSRLTRLFDLAGVRLLGDITLVKIRAAIRSVKKVPQAKKPKHPPGPISHRTRNEYTSVAKSFCHWAWEHGRLAADPLARLKKIKEKRVVIVHPRGALSLDEAGNLLKFTAASTRMVEGLDGRTRAEIYQAAMMVGLRKSELGALNASMFDFGPVPTLTLPVIYSKHREEDVVYLSAVQATWFQRRLAGLAPDQPIWPGLSQKKMEECVQRDLKEAGIPYRDAKGKFRDFHSLRHLFITQQFKLGASPDVVMANARHSDLRMTVKYAHPEEPDRRAAMEKMPSFLTNDRGDG